MKLSRKLVWVASVVGAVAVVAIALFLWNPPFLRAIFASPPPVSITAEGFIPADSNEELTRHQSRLIIVTGFHATQLNNDRSLHIYLPPGYYKNASQRYPVLYVHDGKAVFEESDWSHESLNMDIQADRLISEGRIRELIIVGIDNIGENRVGEYSHWDGVDQGKPVTGLGLQHEDFILSDVKPFIDRNFRTLTDRENTALMGASIGGLSTFNVGFRHPEVFGMLAMQSPYFGYGDGKLYEMIISGPYMGKAPSKIWIDVGSTETGFVDMAGYGLQLLLSNGYRYGPEVIAYEAPDGAHSEKSWSERVPSILLYLFGDIGDPVSAKLYTDGQFKLNDPVIKHVNAIVTYDSGFTMTEIMGSYVVEKPEVLDIDGFGGGVFPKAEGTTDVIFTTSPNLTAKASLTVVK